MRFIGTDPARGSVMPGPEAVRTLLAQRASLTKTYDQHFDREDRKNGYYEA